MQNMAYLNNYLSGSKSLLFSTANTRLTMLTTRVILTIYLPKT